MAVGGSGAAGGRVYPPPPKSELASKRQESKQSGLGVFEEGAADDPNQRSEGSP